MFYIALRPLPKSNYKPTAPPATRFANENDAQETADLLNNKLARSLNLWKTESYYVKREAEKNSK